MNWRVFYSLNLAIFTSMLGMGVVIPFMPIYAKTLGATGVSIGVFFASFPLAQLLFMPIIGRLSGQRGRKAFIAGGLLLSSLMSLVYVSAPNIEYLTLGRFFQGIAVALIIPISTAYVGDLAPAEKRGELMGIFNLALTSSIGVGPLFGGWLSDTYGMALSFYLMGGLNLVAFLFVLFFLDETRSSQAEAQRPPSYRDLLRRPSVRGIVLYRMVTSIQMGLWFSFLPLLAVELLQLSQSRIGIIMATYMLVNSLVQVPFGRMADRYSKRLLIIVSGYLASFAFVTILFAAGFWGLLLISGFTGIMGALAGPALTALAAGEGKQGGDGSDYGRTEYGAERRHDARSGRRRPAVGYCRPAAFIWFWGGGRCDGNTDVYLADNREEASEVIPGGGRQPSPRSPQTDTGSLYGIIHICYKRFPASLCP